MVQRVAPLQGAREFYRATQGGAAAPLALGYRSVAPLGNAVKHFLFVVPPLGGPPPKVVITLRRDEPEFRLQAAYRCEGLHVRHGGFACEQKMRNYNHAA